MLQEPPLFSRKNLGGKSAGASSKIDEVLMQGVFLFLGTGASMGTPVVTCQCKVCKSQDRRNHRLRPAGLLKIGGKQILFDAGPDFREQALTYGIERLDAVVLTHGHYDHIGGLDDLRVFFYLKHQMLPCLLSSSTLKEIQLRTPYFFKKSSDDVMGGPRFEFQCIENDLGQVDFCSLRWQIVSYEQNQMQVTGYRVGNFAYVMDLKNYSSNLFKELKGVEVLVLSGLRYRSSPAHLTIEEALDFANKVGAKKTWFSHVSHEIDHEETNHKLASFGAALAYDGLEIGVSC